VSADAAAVARMAQLGARHAELEARGELEPLLETLAADPVYEFYPLRRRMRGAETVRAFYTQFIERFLPLRQDVELVSEWVNATSVAQEYEIALRVEGRVESFRVLGILHGDGERLAGERVYAPERFVRLMTGSLFEKLEPF